MERCRGRSTIMLYLRKLRRRENTTTPVAGGQHVRQIEFIRVAYEALATALLSLFFQRGNLSDEEISPL